MTPDALALRQRVSAPGVSATKVSAPSVSRTSFWRQAAPGFAQQIKRTAKSPVRRQRRTQHEQVRESPRPHDGAAVPPHRCAILDRNAGGINAQQPHGPGSDKTRSRACCDTHAAMPKAPETHVALGATRVGTLLSRLQMHLRTARFLAHLRQDAVWETGCEEAAISMEQLESEMSPSSLNASIRPRIAAAQRGRVQRRVHSPVQPKPRSCGPGARIFAMSRAAARSVAANTAATFAMLQSAARNCKRTLAAPPSASALAVRRRSTVRTRALFPGALTTMPVNSLAVPPPVKPLVTRSAGTLTALAKGQR